MAFNRRVANSLADSFLHCLSIRILFLRGMFTSV